MSLGSVAKVEWGDTSITKASYVERGYTAFSATGPDGYLPDAQWKGPGIVLSAIGARCGKCFLADGDWTAIKNTIVIQGDESSINNRFLFYFLNDARRWKIAGSGQPFITLKTARAVPIPVPSLDEQQRVVAEIEKQFTRLDAGVASLKRVQTELKRYRASVLKAACEGRLVPTEAELARKENRSYETGEQLLQHILKQRREKWNGTDKYKEPAAPKIVDLPSLPEGWAYGTVEQLGIAGEQAVTTGPFGTNLGREDFTDSGVPVLTISCLQEGGIASGKAEFVSDEKANELHRYRLRAGDLLFSRMAAVGRAGIVGAALDGALFNYHIMRLRLDSAALLPKYYLTYVRGSSQVENYLRDVNHGATRPGINTQQLLNMPVALPPLVEQKRIAAEVERRLSNIDEVNASVDANLLRSTRVRQAILRRAFCEAH
jgi:type I restriction enzyme S subunit